MKKAVKILPLIFMVALFALNAFAGVVDFEDGADGQTITSAIPGLEFTATGQEQWVYGDFSTGNYNGPYPTGAYFANGDFFAWMGPSQATGTITFTQAKATYVTIGYSGQHSVVLEAYDEFANLLDTQTGTVNLGTGQLDFITVNGESIAYVKILEGTGFNNLWIIDDLDTDATVNCTEDDQCDDGDFCNGKETCLDYNCVPAQVPPCLDDGIWCNGDEFCDSEENKCARTPQPCLDDGRFCNGEESCSEDLDKCMTSGNPCLGNQTCNEVLDECEEEEDEPEPEPGEKDMWPEGQVSGGCCGC